MLSDKEIKRRQKISNTMKKLRASILPPWNKGKKCPQISKSLKGRQVWNKGKKGTTGMGETNPNWKGGRSTTIHGYIRIHVQGKYIREHRYIMEQYLGRRLKQTEHIHHLNGDKTDNRIENLIIVTNSQHNRIHWPHGFHPNRRLF